MNWTLEVVVVPVSDMERSLAFYRDKLDFPVDHDTKISDDFHIVQLTPPGSGCSIVLGRGVVAMAPGTLKGVQLVVKDVRAARAELLERGVDVSEVQFLGGSGGQRPANDDDALNNSGFVFFDDPDGNSWAVQQIDSRS